MSTHRSARTPDDLRALRDLISHAWLTERPNVPFTLTTLQWQMALSPTGVDWTERVWLWEDDGEVVAIAWCDPDGVADRLIHADHRHGTLEERIIDVQATRAAADGARELTRFSADGREDERAILERHGFAPTGITFTQWYRRLDEAPPEPVLPPGYRVRTITGPAEIEARVEVHRAAFAPSQVTVDRYRRAMASPTYRMAFDTVVEAPDASLAAFTLGWFDPVGLVGELEPVGTHPDHRRQGLALAANRFALARLREAGAIDAMGYAETGDAAATALATAAGFRPLAVHRAWVRPI